MVEKTVENLVDTLFGEQEAVSYRDEMARVIVEEMPHYLFGNTSEGQESLPLANLSYCRPKVVEQKDIVSLIPYLNELDLFEKRWGYAKGDTDRENWCRRMDLEAVPILDRLVEICRDNDVLKPKAVYAYFPCAAENETLFVYHKNTVDVLFELNFPRGRNGASLADGFSRVSSGIKDCTAFIAANVGRNVSEMAKKWLLSGKDIDYSYLHGFALEMLNAVTEFVADKIRRDGGCAGKVFNLGTAKDGDEKIQSVLVRELDARLIDISFSRHYAMRPEYSSLAMVLPK